ncbi:MAG: Ig-like domain-containing protein, partial [Bacteroidales bacterium]|nr:Ig-like domain-containing protein [Bacteroidales bacterium]
MKRKLSLLVILTASFAFWACDKTGPVTPPDSTVAVQSVEIEPKEISLEIGISTKLTATVKPDNASDKTPAWSSDNTSVATVDAKGQVIGIAVGTANITLKVGGRTATCKVTVTQSSASLERAALVAIYNALNGDSWLHKEGWCSNQPLENWYG